MTTRGIAVGLLLFLAAGIASYAQDWRPALTVRSFSGSPLLVELTVSGHEGRLARVAVRSDSSVLGYRIESRGQADPVTIAMTPFLRPGVHELEVRLTSTVTDELPAQIVTERMTVSFVDFVWGRDNLSFGNNATFESSIGTFGEVLAGWVDERFGGVTDAELVLLVDTMYGLFGKNTGRCYAFAGTEVRYWRWPDLLPTWYDATHDLRGSVVRYQREMSHLQLDIVYDQFLQRPGGSLEPGPATREEIDRELEEIARRIDAGEPVAVGFTGPELHHAMVVFGYLRREGRQTIDLLVANNWKSGEALNVHSRDAEIVTVARPESAVPPSIEWVHEGGARDRTIDRLFVVDVRRDPYELSRAPMDALLARRVREVLEGGTSILVVEEASGAWLTDGERHAGRLRSRTVDEIEGVAFDRVSRAYRFAYPAALHLELEIADDAGARVLRVEPGEGPAGLIASIERTDAPEEGATIVRRVRLASD